MSTKMSVEEYKKTAGRKGGKRKPNRPKYRNEVQKTSRGTFASKKELDRYDELKLLEKAGTISGLRTQVKYEVIPTQRDPETGRCIERSAHYTADFVYEKDGKTVVEDTKSPPTRSEPKYILKRKLMLLVHGIRLTEI